MGILNSMMISLADVLKEEKYIPKYQRSYAWSKEQFSDLWDDLDYLVNDGNEIHFFGQVVVHKNKEEGNKFFIIDGQQRLTTFSLISGRLFFVLSKIACLPRS